MNAVFIRIPKTAGTSVMNALSRSPLGLLKCNWPSQVTALFNQQGLVNFGHMEYSRLVARGYIDEEFDKTAFKFSFVRNPYDRALSGYTDLAVRGRGRREYKMWARDIGFKKFCQLVLDAPKRPVGLHHMSGKVIMVDGDIHPNGEATLSSYNPQVRWVEKVKLDFLGRYENLHEDFARLCDMLGIPRQTLNWDRWSRGYPRNDETVVRRRPFMEYYCDETREIVSRVWREDFERFDYPIHH